ncbi:hypothetical protein T552_00547 [Pneumocystis carinii B80]|uniref:Kinase n=1 Tax=Pneumocystis carinii (strain B80) TaxID=1408658 RepID=A0A0W4ZR38_PNEC8|nr:hypothetical protein T552_00547 [Pneumocystis carinii B80]KTW30835.1 hypothetical protein T552_00547 [Pneumocystis carinii B80]
MASSFVPYIHQTAGHDGVLSDKSGIIICKPCIPAEVTFYSMAQAFPAFQRWMPTYMGNLSLESSSVEVENRSSGRSDAIVLENLCYPFVHPCTIDVKLGSRLWDDDASAEKRKRLEEVSKHTTSGCLGFRVSAMRIWNVKQGVYQSYSKEWGKSLTESTISEGLNEFLSVVEAKEQRLRVISEWINNLSQIEEVLNKAEVRMYSSSLLFIYEGDPDALMQRIKQLDAAKQNNEELDTESESSNSGTDSMDSEKNCNVSHISVCRLIDFAHAHWVAGQGPDENVLHGIASLKAILMKISSEYS